ncbi:MAG: bifunctional deaminase-reductase domain protein [Devosia sp.]|nr:bifunctional deaminase-reductase domain protein [Devosia sp.]
MAKLVFAMLQSLDGYVSGVEGAPGLPMPDDALHRHFSDQLSHSAGSLYGRRMYEIMRYWDEDQPAEDDVGNAFATAWREKPKWVVSRTLHSVGPNATLVNGDLEQFVRTLKAEQEGTIEVAGPELAGGLAELGLLDEYQLYLRPVVLGGGKPFFNTPRSLLHLVSSEQLSGDTMKLTYVPA